MCSGMLSELWVVSGECGLNEHTIVRILDHEPSQKELDEILETTNTGYTGWAGLRVTAMYEHHDGDWRQT